MIDVLCKGIPITILGTNKIYIGKKIQNEEIQIQDPVTGQIKILPKIIGEEIYSLDKQHHSNFFILDLETGKRGWYPGCKAFGSVKMDTALKKNETDESETLIILQENDSVKILNIIDNLTLTEWYEVEYQNFKGYVRVNAINNIRYTN